MMITLNTTSYNAPNLFKKEKQSFKGLPASGAVSKAYGKVTDGIAHGEGWLASTKPVQKLIDFLKDKNYQQHIVATVGMVLSGFYMLDTARSKTIEKDQKMPLIMNQGIVAAASTVGGYTLDNYLTKKLSKFTETFNIANIKDKEVQKIVLDLHAKKDNLEKADIEKLFAKIKNVEENKTYTWDKDIVEAFEFNSGIKKQLKAELKKSPNDETIKKVLEEIDKIPKKDVDKNIKAGEIFIKNMKDSNFMKKLFSKQAFDNSLKLVTNGEKNLAQLMTGLKIAKSIMVFGLIYRFISPVVATPIANNISARLEKKKQLEKQA